MDTLSYLEKLKLNIEKALKSEDFNIEAFNKRYTTANDKTTVLWTLQDLVKKGECIDKAFEIAKIYSEDKDPTAEQDNLNKKMESGEDINNIYTVRGTVPWLLQNIIATLKTEYYPDILTMTKLLAEDPVYYVRAQATVSLSMFAANIRAVASEKYPDFNFTPEDRDRTLKIAFNMLRDNKDLPTVLLHVAYVFDRLRFIDKSQAEEVLSTFFYNREGKLNPEYLTTQVAPLALFFAEYRKKSDDNFDNVGFQEFFKKLIVDASEQSEELKSTIIWTVWKQIQMESANYDSLKKYIPLFFEGKFYTNIISQIEFLVEEVLKINVAEGVDIFEKGLAYTLRGLTEKRQENMQLWLTNIQESVEEIAKLSPQSLPGIFATLEKIIIQKGIIADIVSVFSSYRYIPEGFSDKKQIEDIAKKTYASIQSLGTYPNLPPTL